MRQTQRRPAPRGVARSFSAHHAPAGNHHHRGVGGVGGSSRRRHNNNNNSLVAPSCFNSATTVKLAVFMVGFLSTATFSVVMYWRAKAQLRPYQMIGIAQQQRQQQRGSLLRPPKQQQQQQQQQEESSSSRTRQSFSKPSKQQQQQQQNGDNNKPPKHQNWLNPRTSHPPMSMDLTQLLSSLHDDDDDDKQSLGLPAWQRQRFTCLAHIRRVQNQTLHNIIMLRNNSSSSSSNHESSSSSLSPFNLVLIDPAYHANVGDHMITVAEQVYLQQFVVVHHPQAGTWRECSYFQAGPWAPLCQTELSLPAFYHEKTTTTTSNDKINNTNANNVAFWHGGGNWGDLWDSIQNIRTASMTTLLDSSYTQIIGMPQSLYFVHAQTAVDNAQAFRRAVMEGLLRNDNKNQDGSSSSLFWDNAQLTAALQGRLVLTWREQESLEQATKLYPYVQHVLVPDIAFQLGPFNATALRRRRRRVNNTNTNTNDNIPPQVDVLLFLRTDAESVYSHQRDRQSIRQLLLQNPTTSRFTYSIVDWNDRLDRFDSNDYYFTDTAIQLLDSGRVVICDRLHAAVLAFLSGIPFVMVDQVSGKLTKTLRFAMRVHDSCHGENAMWDRADNLTDALTKAAVLWDRTKSSNAR